MPLVVDRLPGQHVADVLGDVVVAEADRVGVAERPRAHLRTRPDADAGQRAQPAVELDGASRRRPAPGRSRPGRRAGSAATGRRRRAARSHSHDGTARSSSGEGCTHRRTAGSGSLGGPGARSPKRWTSRRKPAKASWPVTFCSMIAGTSDSITRPLAPMPPVAVAAPRVLDRLRRRHEAGRVVVGAEHPRQLVERPLGAAPPGLGGHRAGGRVGLDPERGRALRRADAAPDRAVGRTPEGRVAARRGAAARARRRTGHGQSGSPHPRRAGRDAWTMAADYVGARPTQWRGMLLARLVDVSGPGRRHPLATGQARPDRRPAREVAADPGAERARPRRVLPLRHAAPAPHRRGLARARRPARAGRGGLGGADRGRRDARAISGLSGSGSAGARRVGRRRAVRAADRARAGLPARRWSPATCARARSTR